MNTDATKERKNSKMNNDLVNTIKGALEMALLVKQNRYDQNVLPKNK